MKSVLRRLKSWALGESAVVVPEDEHVIIRAPGSLSQERFDGDGIVVLTDRCVRYRERTRWRLFGVNAYRRAEINIPLHKISTISRGQRVSALAGGFPGLVPFTLELTDGRKFVLQTVGADQFQAKLRQLIADTKIDGDATANS
jgi:hypothetical protein